MAVREVLLYPHPVLKQVARETQLGEGAAGSPAADAASAESGLAAAPGGADSELVARVAEDLLATMRSHPGCVGLAAPQFGDLVRMIVVDVTEHRKTTSCHGLLLLVNPVVVESEGGEVAREGCLSIPDLTANVRRATRITLTARRPDGGQVELETEGFEARCLLHEIDHLDGILFLDRVDSLSTDVFRRKNYR